ncbi:MAG: tRNA lysidine(34) synthetase TilS [Alphaproteobacteria bacterium]|jgi:tRNA(Ile)-lysidine synthase
MPLTLSDEENRRYVEAVFEKAMTAFGISGGGRFAAAVSGGADSMALFRLLDEFIRKNGGELLVLTVDHGLRPESSAEAVWTAAQTAQRGHAYRVLKWQGEKPQSGIEKTAREKRYALLFEACREKEISALFLGHHRRDQAETFLMRRARHSGEEGLAAMSAVRSFAFGRMFRPLLGLEPEALRRYNRTVGQEWLEDPTNYTDDFERGRLRRSVSADDMERAFRESLEYGRRRRAAEEEMAAFVASSVTVSDMGYALFPHRAFAALPEETARRCLGEILRAVANRPYRPAAEALDALRRRILSGAFRGATLGGCRVAPSTKGHVLVWRERADLPPPLSFRNQRLFYWDRFAFELSAPWPEELTVKALDNNLKVEKTGPRRCFLVLPALFDREGLFLAPHLGYKKTGISCRVDFAPLFPLCREAEWMCPVLL